MMHGPINLREYSCCEHQLWMLNIEVTTGDGKEFLCLFPMFETALSVTVDKTFAVKC